MSLASMFRSSTVGLQLFKQSMLLPSRQFQSTAPLRLSAGEQQIYDRLKKELDPTEIQVADISGGCGASYHVYVASPKFKGLSMLKQHQLVNTVLKEELKSMHALRIETGVPSQ
eukprot:comp12102_c0_seq1/m.6836 comp12102_c0_seq1/g.6836  ORF comp12102_c0_seq1/g.6836 comp12102_c0_seq1/m.6836 type:complete len:114 (-) comp12102_c0_seq1:80-421(-)